MEELDHYDRYKPESKKETCNGKPSFVDHLALLEQDEQWTEGRKLLGAGKPAGTNHAVKGSVYRPTGDICCPANQRYYSCKCWCCGCSICKCSDTPGGAGYINVEVTNAQLPPAPPPYTP